MFLLKILNFGHGLPQTEGSAFQCHLLLLYQLRLNSQPFAPRFLW